MSYDKVFFASRDYLDLLVAHFVKMLANDHHFEKILDVGCGTGRLVNYLNNNGFEAKGCDTSEEAIRIASQINASNDIYNASATKLPFNNRCFDFVVSISVVEHLTENQTEEFLIEANRLVNSNGAVLLVTPNYSSPLRLILGRKWYGYREPTHINFFTPRKISLLLKKHGFKKVEFRHKTVKNVSYDQHLPRVLRNAPVAGKNLLNYLMFSSPLALFRESIWVYAQK